MPATTRNQALNQEKARHNTEWHYVTYEGALQRLLLSTGWGCDGCLETTTSTIEINITLPEKLISIIEAGVAIPSSRF